MWEPVSCERGPINDNGWLMMMMMMRNFDPIVLVKQIFILSLLWGSEGAWPSTTDPCIHAPWDGEPTIFFSRLAPWVVNQSSTSDRHFNVCVINNNIFTTWIFHIMIYNAIWGAGRISIFWKFNCLSLMMIQIIFLLLARSQQHPRMGKQAIKKKLRQDEDKLNHDDDDNNNNAPWINGYHSPMPSFSSHLTPHYCWGKLLTLSISYNTIKTHTALSVCDIQLDEPKPERRAGPWSRRLLLLCNVAPQEFTASKSVCKCMIQLSSRQ